MRRLVERHPAGVVDFVRRSQGAADGAHLPVPNGLPAIPAVSVLRRSELRPEPAPQSRLFLHLAKRRRLLAFAGLELALRVRPVVVGRTMDEDDLDVARARTAPDQPTAGADGLLTLAHRGVSRRGERAPRRAPEAARGRSLRPWSEPSPSRRRPASMRGCRPRG